MVLAYAGQTRRPQENARDLADERYVSVTTFRRNGVGVATPVEFVMEGDYLLFRTLPGAAKVKRLRNEPRVLLAPCTMRGKIIGRKRAGTATLLTAEETEALLPKFGAKYGLVWRILSRLRRPRSQGVRVDLRA
jgi:uncharacterized protein